MSTAICFVWGWSGGRARARLLNSIVCCCPHDVTTQRALLLVLLVTLLCARWKRSLWRAATKFLWVSRARTLLTAQWSAQRVGERILSSRLVSSSYRFVPAAREREHKSKLIHADHHHDHHHYYCWCALMSHIQLVICIGQLVRSSLIDDDEDDDEILRFALFIIDLAFETRRRRHLNSLTRACDLRVLRLFPARSLAQTMAQPKCCVHGFSF